MNEIWNFQKFFLLKCPVFKQSVFWTFYTTKDHFIWKINWKLPKWSMQAKIVWNTDTLKSGFRTFTAAEEWIFCVPVWPAFWGKRHWSGHEYCDVVWRQEELEHQTTAKETFQSFENSTGKLYRFATNNWMNVYLKND